MCISAITLRDRSSLPILDHTAESLGAWGVGQRQRPCNLLSHPIANPFDQRGVESQRISRSTTILKKASHSKAAESFHTGK